VLARRTLLGGALALAAAPRAARAQPGGRAVRLGVLLYTDPGSDPNFPSFREAMRDLGYVEGRNLTIEYRYAEGRSERLVELAADLVRTRPDVIFVLGGDVAPSAAAATATIPIVVAISTDPVRGKLVGSLARPGGNVTGLTFQAAELAAKRLQLLKEAAPRISRLSVIWNPQHVDDEFRDTEAAARSLGVQVQSLELGGAGPAQLESAFQTATAWRCDSLVAVSSRQVSRNRQAVIDFATRQRLPLAGGWGPWAENGALLSYGADLNLVVRRAAGYVDRIAKGARPGDLPFEQPTKFELVVNVKTAKALGLVVPQSLLLRADRVIE
jgi:putative ABC transport system substrate-binding protein